MATKTARTRLRELVESLPDRELESASRYLECSRSTSDRVLRAFLGAPIDNEPVAEDEREVIQEAREELARGERIPWQVARQKLRKTRSKGQAGKRLGRLSIAPERGRTSSRCQRKTTKPLQGRFSGPARIQIGGCEEARGRRARMASPGRQLETDRGHCVRAPHHQRLAGPPST